MILATLRPLPPAETPHASVVVWVIAAIVLAVVVASGVLLTSRR